MESHDLQLPRRRVHLEEVGSHEMRGIRIPHREDASVAFRGSGPADYACGRCGALLAIGVRPGMFSSLVLECGCGAMNRVPDSVG